MKELKLEAKVDNLSKVLEFIDSELENLDCPVKIQMQIDIAVEEMFVNISRYAYAPNEGEATIRFETQDDGTVARITLIDSGIPYDPLAKEDPDITLPAEERQIGGLGIYMVKKSMDDMVYEYRNNQNVLTLFKKIVL
ncbi:MAG: ATP-binding protein [Butyrivibrio sp.]|nr:ATP-binding protein [Butyrivibrio sp.]